jgi:hypothetical protein
MTNEATTQKQFVVEIHDEIGYTKDLLDLAELPEGLRVLIVADPLADTWTWEDEDGGTWEATSE